MTAAAAPLDVLVIEDDEDLLGLLTARLQRLGHAVRGALRGEAGLASAFARAPELVIVDLLLPDISGWTVIERLAEHPATRDVPVLVASVLDPDGLERRGNVRGHLVKPFRMAQLAAALRRVAG